MKRVRLFVFVALLLSPIVGGAQTVGGTFNTSFKPLAADLDKTGRVEPACLYTDTSYTVQRAGKGTITLICYLDQDQKDSIWPDPRNYQSDVPEGQMKWSTWLSIKVNGVWNGGIMMNQETGFRSDGSVHFGSGRQSLTFPVEVEPGPLTIEIYASDGRNDPDPPLSKRYNHSVAGQLAYAVDLPSDLTNEFDQLRNRLTALEVENEALKNDLNNEKGKITDLQDRADVTDTEIAAIKNKIELLQSQVTNNYTELKSLIASNSELIANHTTRIEKLEAEMADLGQLVSNNYNALLTIINNLSVELKQEIKDLETKHDKDMAQLQEDLQKQLDDLKKSTDDQIKDLEDKLANNKDLSDSEIQELKQQISDLNSRITKVRKRSDNRDWAFSGAVFGAAVLSPILYDEATSDDASTPAYSPGMGTVVPAKEEENNARPVNEQGAGWIKVTELK